MCYNKEGLSNHYVLSVDLIAKFHDVPGKLEVLCPES